MTFSSRTIVISLTILVSLLYAMWEDKRLKSSIANTTDTILKEIPNVEFETLDLESTAIKELIKKSNKDVVAVHFWGTWCAPCITEFPEMVNYVQKLKDKSVDFFLIAVNDKPKDVKKFLKPFKKYEKTFTILLDNKNIHSQFFGTVRVPETYFFDKTGKILKKFKGPQDWANPFYVKFLDQHLSK